MPGILSSELRHIASRIGIGADERLAAPARTDAFISFAFLQTSL